MICSIGKRWRSGCRASSTTRKHPSLSAWADAGERESLFLLKRWRQSLEKQEFQAIYFNAWEDDFCDDPLLAIMGQLSEHFSEGKLKEMSLKIAEIALGLPTKPLIGEAIKFEDVKPRGVLHNYHLRIHAISAILLGLPAVKRRS